MRRFLNVIGVFFALTGGMPAQGGEEPVVRADFGFASRQVFRGLVRAGPSAQGGAEFAARGFRAGVWGSLPFDSGETGELDFSAAYAWPATDRLTLEASANFYDFPTAQGGATRQSQAVGLTATWASIAGFTPSLFLQRDFRLEATTVQAAVASGVALPKFGAFLELNLFAGWTEGSNWRPDGPGPRRRDGYGYFGGEARVPYRIGPHSTVVAGLHFTDTAGRSIANGPMSLRQGSSIWATLGVSLDF